MNNKHYTNAQMVDYAKRRIRNGGFTWEQVAESLGVTPKTIRAYVSSSYTRRKSFYKELLAVEKANRETLLAQAKEVLANDGDEIDEVIVTETGALIKRGSAEVLAATLPIFIPLFCIRELEKLSASCLEAEHILAFYGAGGLNTVNLRYKEELFCEPSFPVTKNRTIGVVAVCCELWVQGYKVRLLTSSREVAKLAEEQGINDLIIDLVS